MSCLFANTKPWKAHIVCAWNEVDTTFNQSSNVSVSFENFWVCFGCSFFNKVFKLDWIIIYRRNLILNSGNVADRAYVRMCSPSFCAEDTFSCLNCINIYFHISPCLLEWVWITFSWRSIWFWSFSSSFFRCRRTFCWFLLYWSWRCWWSTWT